MIRSVKEEVRPTFRRTFWVHQPSRQNGHGGNSMQYAPRMWLLASKPACCESHVLIEIYSMRLRVSQPNRIESLGNATVIFLRHKGYEVPCYIDAADYHLVKDYRWSAHKGQNKRAVYAYCVAADIRLHWLIAGKGADHIDRDSLNNRRDNLRPASASDNNHNQGLRADNTTGFKGVRVYRYDSSRFIARITVDGKEQHLGVFDTAVEAGRAYNEAVKKYHGEFAVLNELPEDDLIFNQK